MITCTRCHQEKTETEFPYDKSRPSGLFPYCKPCCCDLQRQNKRNKESPIPQAKTCRKCKVNKALSEFPEQAGRRDGRSSCCLPCAAWGRDLFIKSRKSREKKSSDSYSAAYYEKNRDKIRSSEKSLSRLRKAALIKEAGGKCVSCKLAFSTEWPQCCFDFHHIEPKRFNISELLSRSEAFYSRNMPQEIKKCVLLCSNCHRKVHSGDLKLQA